MKMKTGVLLVNLGTPDSYSRKDVKVYLTEFLNDPRVIDIPYILRKILVNGIIVPFRSGKSAKVYKTIWTDRGSPLMFHSKDLTAMLSESMGDDYEVVLAMRYRNPSIQTGLDLLRKKQVRRIIVMPLFPQYASATTGSVHDKVMEIVRKWQIIPEMTFINSYCDHHLFIDAWMARASEYDVRDYDHVIFSFHGLPERQIRKGDDTGTCLVGGTCCDVSHGGNQSCYRAQGFRTARAIAARLGLAPDAFTVCFQSRLGRDPWVKPYTEDVIKKLASEGKKRVLAFSPAFVSDCLETIEEIAGEYDEKFRHFGGEKLQLVESLNSHPAWIHALKEMIQAV